MEWNPASSARRLLLWLVVASIATLQAGCIVVPMMYRGRMAPAACDKLEGHRVAVVCTSNSSDFGPSPNADLIARRVGALLSENVKDIDVVQHQRVGAWMDEHDAEYIDYLEIGQGLQADYVLAIEIESLQLQDNATLYKGRADFQLELLSMKDKGRAVYTTFTPPVIYPNMSGFPTTSVSKEQFRRKFSDVVATSIAKHFYEHDLNDEIAMDTPDLGGIR
jgi:hypothetical protein